MKKLALMMLTLMMSLVMFTSCDSCSNKPAPTVGDNKDASGVIVKLDVDHLISTDRQAMYMKFGKDFRWYETCIRLNTFLDGETVNSDPEIVVNIFQGIVESGNGFDTWVFKFQHFNDGTSNVDSIHSFWIEDCPLNEEVIKFNYAKAFERIMEVNAPKPHSKNAILRKPVGPADCNAQWVFGNIKEQLWVDAVTGNVRNSNPAFPEEKGFKMPLGEWP
jgi:hypothetical protein